MTAMSRKPTNS